MIIEKDLTELNQEEKDLLFISLNHVLHHKMEKLGTSDQNNFISLYKKISKTYSSNFKTIHNLDNFLEG